MKRQSLAETHPELAAQAVGWDPTQVTRGSKKKYEWQCPKGHTWFGRPNDRTSSGVQCNVCSNRQILKGFNDLETTHPDIAKQANGWDPSQFMSGDPTTREWKCSFGHTWESKVISRTQQNTKCPVCGGSKVQAGFNDLATTHPEIAKFASGWDPTTVSKGSSKKLKWKCVLGHEWDVAPSSVLGCPTCSNRKILKGFNDLFTTHPEVAAQASGWDPTLIGAGYNKRLEWKCSLGHKWSASPNSRISKEYISGCSICSGHSVGIGFNDLNSTHPLIASEAFEWDTTKVSAGSRMKQRWKCKEGHIYEAKVQERTSGRVNCGICSGRKVLVGYNDLATTHPEVAKESLGWDATSFTAGSGQQVVWRCSLGHEWEATINSRISNKSGCPVCVRQRVLAGYNDLATTHPEVAKEAHEWDATSVVSGSNKKREWICALGHIWEATINSRCGKSHTGCPICSNRKLLTGFNDFATRFPELAIEAVGWNPSMELSGSGNKKRWRCKLGHEWDAKVVQRAVAQTGCPVCAGQTLLVGFNDLATTHPNLAREANGWDAKLHSPGDAAKKSWKCSEGHIWKAPISNRSRLESGCPTCSNSGFDPNADGYFYFLEHPMWEMFQIGITNVPDDRLRRHKKLGWNVVELRGPMDGHLTRQWETSILRMLRECGADLSNEKIAGKFDGYSEAWSKAKFDAKSIRNLMSLTEKFEGHE